VHTNKAKEEIHSLLPIGRQVFRAISRKAGLHHALQLLGKVNTITPNMLLPPSSQLLLLNMM